MIVFAFISAGCSDSVYEYAIKQGLDTNVSTSDYLPKDGIDGRDGKDGDSIDLYSVYSKLVELKQFTGTYAQFVKEYLGIEESEYVANSALTSVVSIYSAFTSTITYQTSPSTTDTFTTKGYSAGSGVIYSINKETGDALIITNYHVVYNNSSAPQISNEINVFLYGNENFTINTEETFSDGWTTHKYQNLVSDSKISATYLGGSMLYDLAVLKVSGSEIIKNSSATPVYFEDSDSVSVGETAVAIGNPSAYGISTTKGIVSVDSEYISMTGVDGVTPCTFRVLRTDASINSGNSGGGLFNSDGKLIGIVNAKLNSSSIENIAYAIPSNVVLGVVENIIRNCDGDTKTSVLRCIMGFYLKALNSSAVSGYDNGKLRTKIVETVSIDSITEGSIVEGLLSAGDIITSVKIEYQNGEILNKEITRTFHFIDLSLTLSVGDKVTIYRTNSAGVQQNPVQVTFTSDHVVEYK